MSSILTNYETSPRARSGSSMLDEFAKRQPKWINFTDEDDKKEFKKSIYDKWMAYLMMRGADQNQYGSIILKNLQQTVLSPEMTSTPRLSRQQLMC